MASLDEWKSSLVGPDPSPIEPAIADAAKVAQLAMTQAARLATMHNTQPSIQRLKVRLLVVQ